MAQWVRMFDLIVSLAHRLPGHRLVSFLVRACAAAQRSGRKLMEFDPSIVVAVNVERGPCFPHLRLFSDFQCNFREVLRE